MSPALVQKDKPSALAVNICTARHIISRTNYEVMIFGFKKAHISSSVKISCNETPIHEFHNINLVIVSSTDDFLYIWSEQDGLCLLVEIAGRAIKYDSHAQTVQYMILSYRPKVDTLPRCRWKPGCSARVVS